VFNFGWRWGFGMTAILSFLREGGAQPEGLPSVNEGAALGYLLTKAKLWGLTIGFAAYGYSFYLLLTWLPGYLVKTAHMNILKSAAYTAIPWMVVTITDVVIGGWLVDHLIARGGKETKVRKTILVIGMLLGLAVIPAAYNIMGFVAPAVTGFIVGASNSFSNAFITAGVVLLVGIVFYLFVLGRIEPIPEPGGGAPMPRPA